MVLAGAFAPVSYGAMAPFMTRFCRASSIFILFFFATEPFALPHAGLPADNAAFLVHHYGRGLGLVLSVLGLVRPSPVFAGAPLAPRLS